MNNILLHFSSTISDNEFVLVKKGNLIFKGYSFHSSLHTCYWTQRLMEFSNLAAETSRIVKIRGTGCPSTLFDRFDIPILHNRRPHLLTKTVTKWSWNEIWLKCILQTLTKWFDSLTKITGLLKISLGPTHCVWKCFKKSHGAI